MGYLAKILKIFTPFMLGYFLCSIYRTINAVLIVNIEQDIPLSDTTFGLATSLYFLSFALMQIPAGILVDHFGPRRSQAGLFALAGIGSILFGLANGPILLLVGRFIIGVGMAGGLTAALAANRLWFEHSKVSHMNNLSFALGSGGAIVASWPTYLLLTVISWQWVAILLGLLTFALAIAILLIVPDSHLTKPEATLSVYTKDLKRIYTDSFFWKITPLFVATGAQLRSLQSLWVTPWLEFEGIHEASILSYFLLIIAIAVILGPLIASLLHLHKISNLHIFLIGGLLTIIFQILIVIGVLPQSYTLWFLAFFFGYFVTVGFSLLTSHFPPHFAGRVSTAMILPLFAFSFLFQYIFGLLESGLGFIATFWIFIMIQIFSTLWYFLGRYATDQK